MSNAFFLYSQVGHQPAWRPSGRSCSVLARIRSLADGAQSSTAVPSAQQLYLAAPWTAWSENSPRVCPPHHPSSTPLNTIFPRTPNRWSNFSHLGMPIIDPPFHSRGTFFTSDKILLVCPLRRRPPTPLNTFLSHTAQKSSHCLRQHKSKHNRRHAPTTQLMAYYIYTQASRQFFHYWIEMHLRFYILFGGSVLPNKWSNFLAFRNVHFWSSTPFRRTSFYQAPKTGDQVISDLWRPIICAALHSATTLFIKPPKQSIEANWNHSIMWFVSDIGAPKRRRNIVMTTECSRSCDHDSTFPPWSESWTQKNIYSCVYKIPLFYSIQAFDMFCHKCCCPLPYPCAGVAIWQKKLIIHLSGMVNWNDAQIIAITDFLRPCCLLCVKGRGFKKPSTAKKNPPEHNPIRCASFGNGVTRCNKYFRSRFKFFRDFLVLWYVN